MERKNRINSSLIVFICLGFGIILLNWFQNEIYDIFTPFLMLPIMLCAFALFVAMLVWSFVYLFKGIKGKKIEAWVPIIITVIIVVMQFTVPYEKANLSVDYLLNQSKREDVVRKIISGELHEDTLGLIKLPIGYKHLSKGGGEVWVKHDGENIQIFFFTVRGMLDSGSTGYIYVSNENIIENGIKEGKFERMEKKKDNWYWGWME